MQTRGRQSKLLLPRLIVPTFYPTKFLEYPDNCIARLCESELLAHADACPTVERKVAPAGAQVLPPFWFEVVRVRTVDVGSAVHGEGGPDDALAGRDEDGSVTVGAAASGKRRGFVGGAGVGGDYGVEPESCGGKG